jgi:hypothetical protein
LQRKADVGISASPLPLRHEIDNGSLVAMDFKLAIPAQKVIVNVRKGNIPSLAAHLIADEICGHIELLYGDSHLALCSIAPRPHLQVGWFHLHLFGRIAV